MKTKTILQLLFCLVSGALADEPIKFPKLLEYENVEVLKVEPDGIRIRHAGGIRRIPVELIPEEDRKRLGLTTEGVDFYRRWKAEEEASQEKLNLVMERLRKEAFTIEGSILQVIENEGVLLDDAVQKNARLVERKIPYKIQSRAPALAKNQSPRTETLYRTVNEYANEYIGLVFISCPTVKLFDKDQFTRRVYPMGSYTYTNLKGSQRTVRYYTTDLQEAVAKKLGN